MSSTQGRRKAGIVAAISVVVVCATAQVGYDFYLKPNVLTESVVKVKTNGAGMLDKNHILRMEDLYVSETQKQDVPKGALTELKKAEGKILTVAVKDGVILTDTLVDVEETAPTESTPWFSIPKSAIYAINGSLRTRDVVNLYLMPPEKVVQGKELSMADSTLFKKGVKVMHVRSSSNKDVTDTTEGNNANRTTSTELVSEVELRLSDNDGQGLVDLLARGYKLWVVRVG